MLMEPFCIQANRGHLSRFRRTVQSNLRVLFGNRNDDQSFVRGQDTVSCKNSAVQKKSCRQFFVIRVKLQIAPFACGVLLLGSRLGRGILLMHARLAA